MDDTLVSLALSFNVTLVKGLRNEDVLLTLTLQACKYLFLHAIKDCVTTMFY